MIHDLQGQDYMYYGHLIPAVTKTYKEMKKMDTDDLQYAKPLLDALVGGFETRFENELEQTEEANDALLAMISLPVYKDKGIKRGRKNEIRELLVQEAVRLNNEPASKNKAATAKKKPTKFDFFSDSEDDSSDPLSVLAKQKESEDLRTKIMKEVYQYLTDDRTEMSILHEYPNVKNVFLRYNTTLPSRHAH